MSTITELALFKMCVENPKQITLDEINLDKIDDLRQTGDLTPLQVRQKKALKLFHMTWSGITKYLRTVC